MRRFSSRTLTQVTRNACKFWLYLPSRIEAPLQLWGRNNRNYLELKDVRADIESCANDTQCTLQTACRKVILQIITLQSLHLIEQLPLPASLKLFLAGPKFSLDYDLEMPGPAPTDENITFFIRHFHYHPNHLARHIHVFPTASTIDDSSVLVKIHHTNDDCTSCKEHRLTNRALDKLQCFKSIRHNNIQKFYGMTSHRDLMSIHMVLERTRASFFYLLVNLAAEETEYLPEEVTCEFFEQMISALHYIHTEYNLFVPVTTRSFLIGEDGQLKLENPLGISHRNNSMSPAQILADTPYKEFYVTWSIGCVLYNMATLLTLDEENHSIPKIEHGKVHTKCLSDRCDCFSANYQHRYSTEFADLLLECLHTDVESAMTLETLAGATEQYSKTVSRINSQEMSSWLESYFMAH